MIGVTRPAAGVAQEPPPDPRMLLNLDLFAGDRSSNHPAGPDDSFIDQIRTLSAMGLIGGAAGHHQPPLPPAAGPNDETDSSPPSPSSSDYGDRDNENAGDNSDHGDREDNRDSGNTLSVPRAQPDGADQDQ
jgi:hypothetical protein